jgi:hypothetical protein
MRRVLTVIGTLTSAGALAVGASAVGLPGADGTSGSVHGDGSFSAGTATYQVSVDADGGRADAKGHLELRSAGSDFHASVDCLLVFGNQALVVGTIDDKHSPVAPGTRLVAEFVDNGQGRNAPPDAVIAGTELDPAGVDPCNPSLVDFSDAFPATRGNFVVRSAG